MEEEDKVLGETLETQEGVESPKTSTEEVNLEELKKKAELADNYKIRAEKAEKALKQKTTIINQDNPINSIDQIKLGKKLSDYSDEELDFVTGAAGSTDPTKVLKTLENPYIQAGIKAIRDKVEKERLTLKPSGSQQEFTPELSLEESLTQSSIEEQEKILREKGLYNEPTRIKERVTINRN